ncbi:MAG: metal ABC transporter permease, partial [Planctomycetota bacterium]
WRAVGENPLALNALLTGLLVSVACGVVGTFVVARRITYIAASISHCVLGGLGAAHYLRAVHGWAWLRPEYGAFASALLAAAVIGIVTLRIREREDTVIGAVWAVGMAVGILFIHKTPGYTQELMSYLFGNILLVSRWQIWLVAGLDVVVIGATFLFYPKFVALCFDEEFARLRNVRVQLYYLLLLGMTAVTVFLLVSIVGIVLVIALLTLPIAIAGRFSRSLIQMMALSTVLCAVFSVGGLSVSYGPDLPAGPTIIVLAGAVYFLVLLLAPVRSRLRRAALSNGGPK